jgi:hypothetical protein
MYAYRVETAVPQNGELTLDLQTFPPGELIEVIILSLTSTKDESSLLLAETPPKLNGHHLHSQADFDPAQTRRRMALNAIQRGKYAVVTPSPGESWPSETFAASKAAEKLTEERRWLQ